MTRRELKAAAAQKNLCVCVEGWRGQVGAAAWCWKKWQGEEWWEVVCTEEWWGWEEDFLRWVIYRPSS